MITTYICKKCKEVWKFIPEDYESEEDYPTICPLCAMPISQMFIDIYHVEGLFEAIKQSLGRLKRDLQRFN